NVEQLISSVKLTNALERSRTEFTLSMPDGSPVTHAHNAGRNGMARSGRGY
ncbi:MAG: hypothetical protein JWN13_6401, partial [Betaproteobacteria bacterium]|nr:hypothetical protein [Betaproteobacteria bacterium]